jgi:hypothetical protein
LEDPVADAAFSDVESDGLLDPVDEGQLVGGQMGRGAERAVVGITLADRLRVFVSPVPVRFMLSMVALYVQEFGLVQFTTKTVRRPQHWRRPRPA